MHKIPPTLKPVNRHFLIVPHFESKEGKSTAGVLLPEDYEPRSPRHIVATVVDVAEDCSAQFRKLRRGTFSDRRIIVDRSMIEEVNTGDKVNYLILENYVVGILRGINES